jgi:predicted type IV restriction endonuclease
MVQILRAGDLTLHEVKEKFNLESVQDANFFPEWQVDVPMLTAYEKHTLDQAQADFKYLDEYPSHEELVKLVVLAPLLSVAGFYRHPFRPEAERQIELVIEENETEESEQLIRGRIDILVLNQRLWVTVIEAKNKRWNAREAIPQALLYMLTSPHRQPVTFGLATNGSEFIFIKLLQNEAPKFAYSRLFSLFNPGNELYTVVGVLRQLAEMER